MGCNELLSASCHSSPPSQLPPSPHHASVAPPAATLSGLAEGRLLPPPPHPHSPWRDYSSFQRPRPKSRTASIWELESVAAEFGQQL
jgi:hypothetical protein